MRIVKVQINSMCVLMSRLPAAAMFRGGESVAQQSGDLQKQSVSSSQPNAANLPSLVSFAPHLSLRESSWNKTSAAVLWVLEG